MKLPTDNAEDGEPIDNGQPYDFGTWPELAGLVLVAVIVFILFHFADGAF